MCEVPCSCAMVFVAFALVVGYLMGRGKEIHVSHEPHTLDEAESPWCPNAPSPMVNVLTHHAASLYHWFLLYGQEEADDFAFHYSWADDFFAAFFMSTVPLSVQLSRRRHAGDVQVPTKMGSTQTLQIGGALVPTADLDEPYNLVPEKFVPRILRSTVLAPTSDCYMRALRRLNFADDLDSTDNNTWVPLVENRKYKRKSDWIMSTLAPYVSMDGGLIHPARENDLTSLFFKDGEWDDGLEQAMAFDLVGTHRVLPSNKVVDGLSISFVLPLNSMASSGVREGFGRYGADMYFDAEGAPVLIETPSGQQVKAGEERWQYWKWVWRSTLVSSVTLLDHLHLTHFRAANILSRLTRSALPPDHFLRRFLSVFTFGSIDANRIMMHSLSGPNHALHRATPFKDFEVLGDVVPPTMPSLTELHAKLFHDEAFRELPVKLQESPYYVDGRLLLGALRNLTKSVMSIYLGEACSGDGVVKDPHLITFRNSLVAKDSEAGYVAAVEGALRCSDLEELLLAFIWTLTGWHRHVSAAGEYLSDPDLAGMSWKEGEAFARPRQCMLAAVAVAFTSVPQPKLDEDFSHVFVGISKEEQMVEVWKDFRRELESVRAVVQQRNAERRVVNFRADPSLVECSAAA